MFPIANGAKSFVFDSLTPVITATDSRQLADWLFPAADSGVLEVVGGEDQVLAARAASRFTAARVGIMNVVTGLMSFLELESLEFKLMMIVRQFRSMSAQDHMSRAKSADFCCGSRTLEGFKSRSDCRDIRTLADN
jgi:hypothetical protein